jgi:hypothetical protein
VLKAYLFPRALVDGVLHGLVEQNPPQSVKKFIKYNLLAIMKEVRKLLK